MFVHEFLERAAERFPKKIALVSGNHRLTYEDLDDQAGRFARFLEKQGLQRGARVVICLPNSAETVISLFGTLKAGGVFVIVHHTIKGEKLKYILDDCGASAIVATPDQIREFHDSIIGSGTLRCVVASQGSQDFPYLQVPIEQFERILSENTPLGKTEKISENDLACLVYTSGSTGEPKGVMETHACIDFVTSSIITYLENTADEIVLNCLPLSFDYGLYQPLMVFKFGGTLILERSFMFPSTVLKKIKAENVTGFPGVPTMFSLLLQMDLSKYDLSSLRYVSNTAASLPPSHIERLAASLPHVQIYSMYGQTECKRILYMPPRDLLRRPGSVGIPIPGTEAWLQDSEGNRLPPGNKGQLIVRGRHVMKGYMNKPKETARTFHPGRFPEEGVLFTGDLFYQDADGFFYFLSRMDDVLKVRGEKVPPKEIETVLYRLPAVTEAAVVGVPDPVEGDAIKAFIVSKDPALSVEDVLAHCKKYLENYMIPKYVEFRGSLPKSPAGKIVARDIIHEN